MKVDVFNYKFLLRQLDSRERCNNLYSSAHHYLSILVVMKLWQIELRVASPKFSPPVVHVCV